MSEDEQCCENCRFSRKQFFSETWDAKKERYGLVGLACHRRSPMHNSSAYEWPRVVSKDWCGEWAESDENAGNTIS